MMYRPTFDIAKPSQIRSVVDKAERINAETPWVVGFTIDDNKTELSLTASRKKPVSRAFEIRLEPLAPFTNYTEEREFKETRKIQIRELATYLQEILDTEKTRDQHMQLDRAYRAHKKDIQALARTLNDHAAYDATVSYTGEPETLTVSIRPTGSTEIEPLMQLAVELNPSKPLDDARVIQFKETRNARLTRIRELLTHLIQATQQPKGDGLT